MLSERAYPARPQTEERALLIPLDKYWHRIGLAAVLVLAAILDFVSLSREGYGNTYYAAAVKSMMENWHNFFFNSFDPGGFVTIDKPPLGFWLQVASAKIFGFNGVALMLPQALAGICSVALLYYLVSRPFGKAAGLLAALALVITPISVVANRNNIVDSTLVLAVLLGAWAVSRAVETGKLRWLLLCAVFVGLGFNIKMLQAFLVLPAFGLMYLVAARVGWGRRILHLISAGIVLLIISLSWATAVDLTPASQRPWVGSTTTNSELDLAIGYNGLQRLTGNSSVGGRNGRGFPGGTPPHGSSTARSTSTGTAKISGASGAVSGGTTASQAPDNFGNGGPGGGPGGNGGGPGGVGENGPTGALRLLDTQLGGQIGWLLPLAVIGLLAGAWRARRWLLDSRGASLLMWGMWLLTMDIFFDIAGFYHTYYLVMVAPAIAALSGIGIVSLWQMYRERGSRTWMFLPLAMVGVAVVEAHILSPYPDWSRWLTPLIIGLALIGGMALAILRFVRPGRLGLPALFIGVGALLAAPAVWSVGTVQASDSGLTPRAGPAGTSTGGPGGFNPGNRRGFTPPAGFTPPTGNPTNGTEAGAGNGNPGAFRPPNGAFGAFPRNGVPGGGPGDQGINKSLLKYLEQHQGSAKYLFATNNAGTAEPYIIATGKPVMAMGGFTGSDPILTTSKLAALVKAGTVHYFLLGGMGGPGGDGGSVNSWVQTNCSIVPASAYSSTGTTSGGFGSSLYACGVSK